MPRPIQAVLFDAGHTLLEMDYPLFAGFLRSRGHERSDAAVVEAERRAVAEWRRGFNVPVGLCHRADGAAATALRRARDAGCVVGVISNSNGSVRRALEDAGLGAYLDFVIDSSEVGMTKPDPRIFALGLDAARTRAAETCYVGDSYFVDVVGARGAGLEAVLFDPGRVWDVRDCAVAADLSAAVDQAFRRVV